MKSVDDTLDVFACHGIGGIMGMIPTAILHEERTRVFYGGVGVFAHHMTALLFGVCVYLF